MTQYYKMPGFTLANANISTKLLLTFFLLTVLVGVAVAVLQYTSRAGRTSQGAAEWILGNEHDLHATEFRPAKSYRELLAITHDHVFSVSILLFVLLHLVALCGIGERLKIALYTVGFLSFAGSLSGPWFIHSWKHPGGTLLLQGSGVGLLATMLFATGLCLFELWLRRPIHLWRGGPGAKAPNPMFPKRRESDRNQGTGPEQG